MAITVHTNPLTNKVSCVGHTDVNLHIFDDGSFQIDIGPEVFTINETLTVKQIAEMWRILFNARD